MGAAVTIELQKPVDASDIRASGSLSVARAEITRLRSTLGHLAKNVPGFHEICYDASDLCLGDDEQEDFERCVEGIAHIRRALQLSTNRSRRESRITVNLPVQLPITITPLIEPGDDLGDSDDSSDSDSQNSNHK